MSHTSRQFYETNLGLRWFGAAAAADSDLKVKTLVRCLSLSGCNPKKNKVERKNAVENVSLLPQMKNLQHPQPQLLLQSGRTTNAVICMHCQAQAKSERERGREAHEKRSNLEGAKLAQYE